MNPPKDVIEAAQSSQRKFGIPAAITIAQWALETGWGKHIPPESNNPFGIKAVDGQPFVKAQTIEYINGTRTIVSAHFRKFETLEAAFEAHAKLLAESPRYAAARHFENSDADFANALTGVYATDPHYGALLNSIIQSSHLAQYDLPR